MIGITEIIIVHRGAITATHRRAGRTNMAGRHNQVPVPIRHRPVPAKMPSHSVQTRVHGPDRLVRGPLCSLSRHEQSPIMAR